MNPSFRASGIDRRASGKAVDERLVVVQELRTSRHCRRTTEQLDELAASTETALFNGNVYPKSWQRLAAITMHPNTTKASKAVEEYCRLSGISPPFEMSGIYPLTAENCPT